MLQPSVALKIVVANRLMQHHLNFEEQRWRSGESTRLSLMWPGFKSRRRHHMLVEFVVGMFVVRTDGRVGVRSRDYQNFSDA